MFSNKFDFNLVPMDKKYLELYYHTYAHEAFVGGVKTELDSLLSYNQEIGDEDEVNWLLYQIENYRINYGLDAATYEISINYGGAFRS